MGGVILDFTVANYKGIAVYQPLINGVGGNLVAVQASRISTALHSTCFLGRLPKSSKICLNPVSAYFSSGNHGRFLIIIHSCTIDFYFQMVILKQQECYYCL